MKYLLQQMIAFFVIILTVLLIFGLSFTQFTKSAARESSYEQLNGYSETVISNMQTFNWNLEESIDTMQTILRTQNVGFYVLDENLVATYPKKDKGQTGKNLVSKEELETLKSGQPIKKMVKESTIDANKATISLFIQPLFSREFKFQGLLLVYQPASNINKSVSSLTQNLMRGFLISSIIAVIISYAYAKFQVNRINRMRKATRQVANGNFDVHLEVKNNDELDDLATDFNQMTLALKESHQEIERQEERRRNFMADVAHEMRTPLTTINGMLEGFIYNAIPEDQRENGLNLMKNETTRLIRLVNENLDYEKILTNQISIAPQKLNATDVLKTIKTQLDQKAKDKNNEIILTSDAPVELFADHDRFVQIIVNLVTNAIQFTEDGEIRIEAVRGYLETTIKISDTGMGISEEDLINIWDRYYKADPSRKNTKYGESGLGLSIVDQLVRLHKGKIEVESVLGEGTAFSVTFPDKPEETNE